jgi:hypothetical protein
MEQTIKGIQRNIPLQFHPWKNPCHGPHLLPGHLGHGDHQLYWKKQACISEYLGDYSYCWRGIEEWRKSILCKEDHDYLLGMEPCCCRIFLCKENAPVPLLLQVTNYSDDLIRYSTYPEKAV